MPSSATSMTVAGILFSAAEEDEDATEVVVVAAAVAALCSDVILISDLTFSSLWSMSNRDALGLIPFPALVMTSARVGHLEAAADPQMYTRKVASDVSMPMEIELYRYCPLTFGLYLCMP